MNPFELFGVNHGQRCRKDNSLLIDPPHCSLRPTLMLFTSKRRTIWTAFTVGTGVVVFRRRASSAVSTDNMMPFLAARTRQLMNEGSLRLKKSQAVQKNTLPVEETFKCQSCLHSRCGYRVICAFCERSTCEDCSRQCVHCAAIFCSLCSIVK